VLVLAITFMLSRGIEFREKTPITRPFDQFPLQVGDWQGRRQSIAPNILEALDLSDYIAVDYVNPSHGTVNFYVAYYESQRKGESIHSPESCLPGSGWVFKQSGTTMLTLANSAPVEIKVSRAVMENTGARQLSYFWFPQRGRILTSLPQLKLYNFWDALIHQRTDGALVRLITPIYGSETLTSADKRLAAFAKEFVPILNDYLPD
jgi:EpsI family protein